MPKRISQPTVLTIAGSDSGGGAGIQADLRTFAALGVHGTTAITSLTAQNPDSVTAIQAVRPAMVRMQIDAVFAAFEPKAVKTGMLYSADVIRVLIDFFRDRKPKPAIIVDPVMVATSGSRLLSPNALKLLRDELLPMALLVTPNLEEANVLAGIEITGPEEMRRAARRIKSAYGCAALVKGGHLEGMKEAVDLFYDGKNELILSQPFQKNVRTHGTGCTYAAAIAAYVARGRSLAGAVELAKSYITQAIARSVRVSGRLVLNHFWR